MRTLQATSLISDHGQHDQWRIRHRLRGESCRVSTVLIDLGQGLTMREA